MIEFLTDQFTNGLGYSSINTARSALSAFGIMLGQYPAGSHPTVIRFMRGVFNIRPLRSRYTEVWDVNKMLRYLRSLSPVKYLSLKDLTIKLTSLIALTNAARTQTLQLLSVHKLKKLNSKFVLFFDGLLKQSRPGNDFSFIELFAFPPDRRLCVFTVLKEYLRRTRVLRGAGETKLLLSYMKPHKPVTNHTISRWIKTAMCRSGIDTKQFTSHSIRAAVTSKASESSVPIGDILKKAGWTNSGTFGRFYQKPVVEWDTFSTTVLNC